MSQQRTVPILSYEDPLAAAAWLARAFGFHETGRLGTHGDLELNGGQIISIGQASSTAPRTPRPPVDVRRARQLPTLVRSRLTTTGPA
jgi:hypothetical protein